MSKIRTYFLYSFFLVHFLPSMTLTTLNEDSSLKRAALRLSHHWLSILLQKLKAVAAECHIDDDDRIMVMTRCVDPQ